MSTTSKSIPSSHPMQGETSSSSPENGAKGSSAANVTNKTAAVSNVASKSRLTFLLLLTVMAVLPIAWGIGTLRLKASAVTPVIMSVEDQADAKLPNEIPLPADRRLADQQFFERRFEVALEYYRSLGSADSSRLPPELLYRIALCQEGLGRWSEALASLRTVANMNANPVLKAAASFGQARIWLRLNEPEQAESFLLSLEFQSASECVLPKNMSRDIAFLIPWVMTQEMVTRGLKQKTAPRGFSGDLLNWSLVTAFAWGDEPPQVAGSAPASAEFELKAIADSLSCRVNRPAAKDLEPVRLETYSVDLIAHGQPVSKIVERLAEECQWKLNWSDLAGDHSLNRTLNITADDRPLCLILTEICRELRSTWTLEDQRLILRRSDPRGEQTRRMLDRTLVSLTTWNPNYRLAGHCRFAQAQIAQSEGDLSKAAVLFSSLVGRDSSPLAIRAAYNAAMNFYRIGDFTRASTQLGYVVDGSTEKDLQKDAQIFLGLLLLDNGETQDAVFQFRRAAEARGDGNKQAQAAVLLGMSFLIQNKFEEAAEAVFTHRYEFEDPEIRNVAAFVTTFARWKCVTGKMKEREAAYLYRAMSSMKHDLKWLGQSGQLLIGRALCDLGFDDDMADLYSHMLTNGVTEAIASEMMYSLAEYDYGHAHQEVALEMWEKLADDDSNRWANRARFRLAEIALEEKNPEKTLTYAKRIQVREGIVRSDIQNLMGRAYQQSGDNYNAARCYAGQSPLR